MPEERDFKAIVAQCERFLGHHRPEHPHEVLAQLSAMAEPDQPADMYGGGSFISDFEAEVAELLGKPAAVFMVSGTMAQQIALRIWADRAGVRNVAFHPTCHLRVHEEHAYRLLHNLNGVEVGGQYGLITLADLEKIGVPLAALLLELPQRQIGGALPEWDDLVAQTTWARERGIKLHMDGARLWQAQPYYGRPLAEIAALFDTVYVSFYKILRGIAGAILAGPEDVIAEARSWQHRQGGKLFQQYPYVLAAKRGLDEHLPHIPEYTAKAQAIAAAISALPDVEVTPNPPQTDMMHIFIRADRERLWEALLDIAEEHRVLLASWLAPTQVPGYQMFELTVGNAASDIPTDEIAALFAEWIERAHA